MTLTEIGTRYRQGVDAIIKEEWHGPWSITKGRMVDTSKLPGFVCLEGEEIIGAVTYEIIGDQCEINTLNSFREGRGVGEALIQAVEEAGRAAGCKRLWLTTSNDNTKALRYYQRRGFTIGEVRVNAAEENRRIKPSVPLVGMDNIPIRDEFELERRIEG